MRYIVTGAAGFIGSHVVEQLIANGDQVLAIDNYSGGFTEHNNAEAKVVVADIRNYSIIEDLFETFKPHYVIHLAAYAAEGLSPWIRRFNYANNQIGSINLINLSIKYNVQHFTFLSSIAVYGDLADRGGKMVEDVAVEPIDPYGISKLAVELDLKAAHEVFGLNYTIFRPHNVYGARQNVADPHRNVIGIFLRQQYLGLECDVYGDGQQTRAFTYVKDIAPVIADAATHPALNNQTFNLGSDSTHTIYDLITYLDIARYKYVPARHEAKITNPSHAKLKGVYDYKETPLQDGLQATREWFDSGIDYMLNTKLTIPTKEL